MTLKNGQQYTIIANQEGLTYKSNNTDVAVVSKMGVVTAIGEGTAIISVINADGDVAQMNVKVIPVSIEVDCNNDGVFNISDVVLLQKWLLAVPDTHLANWQAANLCEDDKLDVFDLCLMKRKLIQ
ncbi:MAG: dockerin type I repeat-containing protein [Ruminococcus sp.]|nr:dockerin type I repeat-containing protein [Ruminococcus sp.]